MRVSPFAKSEAGAIEALTVAWPGGSTPVPSWTSVCHLPVVCILSGGIHLENQSPQILNRAYAVPHAIMFTIFSVATFIISAGAIVIIMVISSGDRLVEKQQSSSSPTARHPEAGSWIFGYL
jgi:hypothetical protein